MAPPPPPPSKTKKRTAKSTYAQRLSIRIENDSDAFEQSVQESMDDFFDDKSFWETMGDSAQAKLLRMMEDWKAFIETRPVDEGHRFAPKTFYRCSGPFIESKVIDTPGKRNPDRVHWSTLEQWLTYLVKPIHNFCTETVNDRDICYGAKLLREGLEPSDTGLWLLFARTGQRLFKKYALAGWRQKKTYWTRYELAMLVDATLNTSASMEVALQQVLLLTLSFLTSARVGAFGYSYDNWKEQGKYLQLGDVAVFRDLVVPGQFQMTVTIKNLKGYNGSKGSVPLVIHLGALQNPWNLFMEPAPVFLALLLHRKQLRDHTTLESLLTGREHQIRYVDDEEPLVQRGTPTRAGDLCGQVARIVHKAGLVESNGNGGGSLKCFRKWGAEDMKKQISEQFAQKALAHADAGSVLEDNYARGLETFDMATLHAHESMDGNVKKSNDALLRHISRSPAVRARATRLAAQEPVDGVYNVCFVTLELAGVMLQDVNTAARPRPFSPDAKKTLHEEVDADKEQD